MNPLVAPWIAECVILSARSVNTRHTPPLPSEFLATFIIFGTLSLAAGTQARTAATTFGWGVVVASLLNLWDVNGRLTTGQIRPQSAEGTQLVQKAVKTV